MTKVVLHGELGQVCGAEWELDITTPGEALRAIDANGGGIYEYLRKTDDGKAEYRVVLDDQDFTCLEDLTLPLRKFRTIHFIPVPRGADNGGTWMTIAGIALIVVGVILSFIPFTSAVGPYVIMAGVSVLIGGVTMLLTRPPQSLKQEEKPGNRPSYLFNGPVNTYRQGNPVPVGYGMLLIGSQVISAGIRVTDIPTVETWNEYRTYTKDSEVFYQDRYYLSKQNNNTGHKPPTWPDAQNAWWRDVT